MKPLCAAAALAAAALLAGCDHHEEIAGPSGLPYACADGRSARIYYNGGDPNRMPARLDFADRSFTLAPAPAMNGLRYMSEAGLEEGRGLAWWAQGDEAAISETSAEGEREIVRCTRVREGETAPPEQHGGHGESH